MELVELVRLVAILRLNTAENQSFFIPRDFSGRTVVGNWFGAKTHRTRGSPDRCGASVSAMADQRSLIPAAVPALGAASESRGVWQWALASV